MPAGNPDSRKEKRKVITGIHRRTVFTGWRWRSGTGSVCGSDKEGPGKDYLAGSEAYGAKKRCSAPEGKNTGSGAFQ